MTPDRKEFLRFDEMRREAESASARAREALIREADLGEDVNRLLSENAALRKENAGFLEKMPEFRRQATLLLGESRAARAENAALRARMEKMEDIAEAAVQWLRCVCNDDPPFQKCAHCELGEKLKALDFQEKQP